VLQSIGELKDLSEDTEKNLGQAMSRFTQDFLRQRTVSAASTPVT
jgi:hypothetical protein